MAVPQIPFGLSSEISCRSFSLVVVNWAICLYLALTQKRSMTDMIRVNIANTVNTTINRVSAVAAASICSIGVSAKEVMCSPVIVVLSVITLRPFNSFNYRTNFVFSPQLLHLHVIFFIGEFIILLVPAIYFEAH
jgi:hypothetical protein